MADQKLLGKRAIVTGGATGIGYGIAQRFIAEGANVIITDIDETGGTRAALALQRGASPLAAGHCGAHEMTGMSGACALGAFPPFVCLSLL